MLRELVGIGTLGAVKVHSSNVTPGRTRDDELVSNGWTILDISSARATAARAASQLAREAALEERFWADVMAVRNAGWAVCRLPHEHHTLGVRFGFSECWSFYLGICYTPGHPSLCYYTSQVLHFLNSDSLLIVSLFQLLPSFEITALLRCDGPPTALFDSTLLAF